ncbi:unnamed protein product [Orchesella dallaii]|uniref:F-box domain-containing protein n=1 Tax=Orchesella dallaii TaxID=48710 RepID=A0ABP1PLT8_9HEXA
MENEVDKHYSSVVADEVAQQPNPVVLTSPKTDPILPPQIWDMVFEYLSKNDLEAVMKTCPEWNLLLQSKKGELLFPKVLSCMGKRLSRESALVCRLVNKECKSVVEQEHPEILQWVFMQEKIQEFAVIANHLSNLQRVILEEFEMLDANAVVEGEMRGRLEDGGV